MNLSFGIFIALIVTILFVRKRKQLSTILTGFDTSKITKIKTENEAHAKMILLGGGHKNLKEVEFPTFQAHTGAKAIWSDCGLHPMHDEFYFKSVDNYYTIEENTLIYIPANKNIQFVGNDPPLKFYI